MGRSLSFKPVSFSENLDSRMLRSFATREPAKLFVKASSHDAYGDLFQVVLLRYITKLN